MTFAILTLATTLLLDVNVTGAWEATYVTPLGPQEVKIYLTQEGPRITGHTTSEFGEAPIRGSISGDEVKFSWTESDGGKPLEIVVTGKVDGDAIVGTATLGGRGQGRFRAERTNER
jgi:hypothetical protein